MESELNFENFLEPLTEFVPTEKDFDFEHFLSIPLEECQTLTPEESVVDSPFASPSQEISVSSSPSHELFNLSQEEPFSLFTSETRSNLLETQMIPSVPAMHLPNVNTMDTFPPECNVRPVKSMKRLAEKEVPRSRKKRKVSNNVTITPQNVILTRDELLNLSSEQYEEYIQQLADTRELTEQDQEEIKRQRRLIKNRESAQASRERKKGLMEELQKKVYDLTTENTKMRNSMSVLQSENTKLKNEVSNLQFMINKSGPTSTSSFLSRGTNFISNIGKQVGSFTPTFPVPIPPKVGGPINNIQAGVVLFVMLFSFGLLFNLGAFKGPITMPNTSPAFAPRILGHGQFQQACFNGDVFDSISKDDHNPTIEKIYKRLSKEESEPIDFNADFKLPASSVMFTSAEMDMQDSPIKAGLVIPPIDYKPNTTYLLCETVSQIVPPENAISEQDYSKPPFITFLIPPDSLQGSNNDDQNRKYNRDSQTQGSFLQVTCQVLDVAISPTRPTIHYD